MKKLNIAILIVLLVFQTILSPVSVFANETDLLTNIDADQPVEDVGEGEGVTEDPKPDEDTEKEEEPVGDAPQGTPGALISETDMNISNIKILQGDTALEAINDVFTLNVMDFEQSHFLEFDFLLKDGHKYKKGDFYEFEIPTAFKLTSSEGNIPEGASKPVATYTVDASGKVKLTFTEEINDGKGINNGKFKIGLALADEVKQGDFEKEYTFNLNGTKTLVLNELDEAAPPETLGTPKPVTELKISDIKIMQGDNALEAINDVFTLNIKDFNQSFYLAFDFDLENEHEYKEGDFYEFKIPKVFKLTSSSGNIPEEGSPVATYLVDENGRVKLTFTEAINDGAGIENGKFRIGWALSEEAKQGDFEKEYPFELNGPKFFKIIVENNGVMLSKESKHNKSTLNPTELEWEVYVNLGNKNIGGKILSDTLAKDLVENSLKVEQLKTEIGKQPSDLTGIEITAFTHGDLEKGELIKFDDGDTNAYRIIYKTKITDEQRTAAIGKKDHPITNSVTLNGETKNVTAYINFDQPIEKSVGNVYYDNDKKSKIDWKIKINGDKRDISGGVVIKDTLTVPIPEKSADRKVMAIDESTIKIEPTLPKDRWDIKQTVDTEGKPVLTITINPVATEDKQTYELTYTTVDDVVDEGYSVSNKAEISYDDGKNYLYKKDASQTVNANMLTKTHGKIDYLNKTIDWEIKFNERGYSNITGIAFEDVFKSNRTSPNPTDNYSKMYAKDLTLEGSYLCDRSTTNDCFELVLTNQKTDGKGAYTEEGFKVNAIGNPSVSGPLTLKYKTTFDPTKSYSDQDADNSVQVEWTKDGTPYINTANKEAKFNEYTVNNGKKFGSYNPQDKTIKWKVDINYNLHEISTAKVSDKFGNKQTMSEVNKDTVKVIPLKWDSDKTNIEEDSEATVPEYAVEGTHCKENKDCEGFVLTFKGPITGPYRIVYSTEFKNQFIGDLTSGNGKNAKNTAVLTDGETAIGSPLVGSVTIESANEYLSKDGRDIKDKDYLEWTLTVNESQSYVKTDSVITDRLNDGQMLVEDFTNLDLDNQITKDRGTFEVRPITYPDPYSQVSKIGDPIDYTGLFEFVVDSDKQGFTVKLLKDINEAYTISYVADISGSVKSELSNTYSFDFKGTGKETGGKTEKTSVTYQNVWGTGNQSKYKLKLLKQDATTNTMLSGVKFELYYKDKVIQAATTDANGQIIFDEIKYGKYELKETIPHDGSYTKRFIVDGKTTEYKEAYEFTTTGKNSTIELTLKNAKICTEYELTVQKNNVNVGPKEKIIIKNEVDSVVKSGVTDSEGKIIFDDENIKNILVEGKTYKVYSEANSYLGEISVTYEDNVCGGKVNLPNTCEVIFINVNKDRGTTITNPTSYDVVNEKDEIVVTGITSDTDGEVKIPTLEEGKYKLVQTEKPNGFEKVADIPFKVTDKSEGTCSTEPIEIKHTPNTCEVIFITKFEDKVITPESTYEVVEKNDPKSVVITEVKSDETGKIKLPKINPGEYKLVQKTPPTGFEKAVDIDFTVTKNSGDDCQPEPTEIPHTPKTCEVTFINKDKLTGEEVKASSEYKVVDENGAVYVKSITSDSDGNIVVPKLPPGKYELIQVKTPIGYLPTESIEFTVTENTSGTCTVTIKEIVVEPTKACPIFALTVQNVNGVARPGVTVTIKDEKGKTTIATATTDSNGVATFKYTIEPGTYTVFEGENEIGKITVIECKATVKPQPPGPGGGGSTPPPTETPDPDQPGKPGEETPDPDQPGKPGEETPDPDQPGKPGEETPDPDQPGKPGEETPDPDQPGKPGEETPDPDQPVKPGEETPDPDQPSKPGEETTKPEKPTSPELDKVIDKIPSLPGVTPVPGESPDTPKYEVPNISQIVEELKQDPTKLIQTNEELKEFIDMYNNLSPEEQAEIDKLIDMNALKNLQAQLDKEAAKFLAANNNQEKLPQTDNANQTGMMLGGLLLIGMSLVLLRRKWASSTK